MVGGLGVDAAVRCVWTPTTRIESFVNHRLTRGGGAHVLGLTVGLGMAIRAAAQRLDIPKGRSRMTRVAIERGPTAALHVLAPEPQFDQCRSNVRSASVFFAVRDVVSKQLAGVLQRERDRVEAILASGAPGERQSRRAKSS